MSLHLVAPPSAAFGRWEPGSRLPNVAHAGARGRLAWALGPALGNGAGTSRAGGFAGPGMEMFGVSVWCQG